MTVNAEQETLSFQTEVQQLLNLMIHSLYSNKEIFLRELISNASDAADKLRFEALKDQSLLEDDPELKIRVTFDPEARTVTVTDNGIGMTRDDAVDNLGTIAKSGTRQFLDALTGDQANDAKLIGQFGVGFYSAFIVSKKVEVRSRRAGEPSERGILWASDGQGAYDIAWAERPERGTEVTLHLADGEDEFLNGYRLREIIRRYSDHISLPIVMPREGDEADGGDETVNRASALWMRSKSEIADEEYQEFYKHVAHDFEAPLTWIHNKVEGKQSYTSLLFIPQRQPFDLFDRESAHGVKLYVRRVFILDDTEHRLVPRYLRFVRGVVDSDDLPLNVSRELLQHNELVDRIRGANVKRVLDLLERMAKNEPEQYATFWEQFGTVLKEGPAEDFANRERIAALLRFSSTAEEEGAPSVSLDDYIARMKDGQQAIYYVHADSFNAARHSPHLEVFRKKGVEVLLLHEPVDEWLVAHLGEYQGKRLQSVAKGELDLGELGEEADKAELEAAEEAVKPLLERLRETLAERVDDVRVSHRLTDSPACLVVGEYEFGMSMQRMLKAAGHPTMASKPALEINPEHPIIQRLNAGEEDGRFDDWAQVLFEQALLTEGGQLDDPAAFAKRLNSLLTR
ncbi:molecular chaperone HtpG [Ectothiorhodospiraceae bacterium WFHF3C12]|nr:molecular chaperone HtpG [Ectothiorhodospiraceae bacterium WFHF3C12]